MSGFSQHRTEAQELRLGNPDRDCLGAGISGQGPSKRRQPVVPTDLNGQLAALAAMNLAELRAEWRRLYRAHPPKKVRRDVLELGVAFKLQERVLGGLGAAARRRLADLDGTMASRGDFAQIRTAKLKPGARLMREWGGITHDVIVVEDGFSWGGTRWRSLSAIASAITGTHWSGPRFFGLNGKAKSRSDPQESADA